MLAYMCAWLVTALLLAGTVAWAMRADGQWANHGVHRVAQELTKHVRFDAEDRPLVTDLPPKLQWLFVSSPLDVGYRVFEPQGKTLLWSSEATRQAWERSMPAKTMVLGRSETMIDGVAGQSSVERVPSPAGHEVWLQVVVSERMAAMRHEELGSAVEITMMLAAAISIVLLGLVLFLVVQRVLAPVQRVSNEAMTIEPHGPWPRLGTQGLPVEILPLVTSFNQALDRLEEGFERQRTDASCTSAARRSAWCHDSRLACRA